MNEGLADTLPFLVLNAIMDDDYREAVVRRALGYRREATQYARRCLGSAIRKEVRVKGYRDASRARMSLLLNPVVESSYRSNELMGAILLWIYHR